MPLFLLTGAAFVLCRCCDEFYQFYNIRQDLNHERKHFPNSDGNHLPPDGFYRSSFRGCKAVPPLAITQLYSCILGRCCQGHIVGRFLSAKRCFKSAKASRTTVMPLRKNLMVYQPLRGSLRVAGLKIVVATVLLPMTHSSVPGMRPPTSTLLANIRPSGKKVCVAGSTSTKMRGRSTEVKPAGA